MNPEPNKPRLQHKQRQEEESTEQQSVQQQSVPREFASVEEMLRYDVNQTPPPPAIAERLRDSLEAEPPAKGSWWRRLFKKQEPI